MISYLLSCAYQTRDMINVYHALIISYLYPALYHILSLSYHDPQTDPKSARNLNYAIKNSLIHCKKNCTHSTW